ncbi:MAG: hypothetical protein ACYTEP_08730 [Planctomycetota bacterium]
MRLSLQLIASAALIGLAWCSFFSCSSLQGEPAPPITGGTLVVDGSASSDTPRPQPKWQLLAFFSPT